MTFFSLPGSFEASFHENTFGRKEEEETRTLLKDSGQKLLCKTTLQTAHGGEKIPQMSRLTHNLTLVRYSYLDVI